ncbi:Enoyl-Hydratase AKT3-1 [Hyphodiscus hymeniophilus]|uniref:Enoyl-Hydratase AKT3-1 n=1 Tax=Hyphodiscus hymeniophilus TaxID=353542 RepID=A0A9P7AVA8_9HELO|nr:Enoyl-Hydratase AKT3-1 [Hyphodiscus hymeniophilus]
MKLDRLSAHQAFTDQMADSLITAYDMMSSDPRVRAIVLTSADTTNKFFCAGMDFNAEHRQNSGEKMYLDTGGQVSIAMQRCTKPIVVAINGAAVGVGITMTLPANIRVASKHAKCGFVFGRRGLCMEACSSFFLPRLVGTSRAMHLITTGAVYPASHKLLDGLFSEIVEPEQVVPTALKIADDIAANVSIVSVKVMKDLIFHDPRSPEEANLLESKIFHDMVRGKDAQEGVQSFLIKRQPEFKGTMEEDAPRMWPWWTSVDVKAEISI